MPVTEAALRARPQFRRYVAARVVSVAGTLLTAVVLPVLIYRLTGSVVWTAAVAVAQALPYTLLGLLTGRLHRRSVVLGADLAGAGVLASIPAAWLAGASPTSAWHVLAVAFAAQVLFVISDVADDGALTTLLGDDGAEAGRAAVSGSTTLVQLMVPLLIGLAVVIAAPELLLGLAALGAVLSAVLVRTVPRRRIPRPRHEPGGALHFLRRDPAARTMALVGITHAVAGGAFAAVLLPWADEVLGVSAVGDARLALVVSCWVIGGLIATGLTPALQRRLGAVRLGIEALLASLATGFAVLGCTHWLPAVLVATLWGTAYWVVVCNAVEHRRAAAPPQLRSRVDACAVAVTHGVGFPAGAVLAATVAVAAGPRIGLATGLAVLALGIAVAWRPLRGAARAAVATSARESRSQPAAR